MSTTTDWPTDQPISTVHRSGPKAFWVQAVWRKVEATCFYLTGFYREQVYIRGWSYHWIWQETRKKKWRGKKKTTNRRSSLRKTRYTNCWNHEPTVLYHHESLFSKYEGKKRDFARQITCLSRETWPIKRKLDGVSRRYNKIIFQRVWFYAFVVVQKCRQLFFL